MAKKKAAKRTAKVNRRLPGMETTAIKPIENAALAYEQVRDERMALTEQETAAQETLKNVMRKHGKRHYKRKLTDGSVLEVNIVTEKEKAKVKHTPPKE